MRRLVVLTLIAATVLTTSTVRADNSFFRITARKPNATVADGVRAFFILALGPDPADMAFEKQAQALIDMKIIRKGWAKEPDAKLTRGKVAYMLCQTCGIKGGVTMHLTGPSERYCYRECKYLELMVGGTPRDYMSGGELLGALAKAAEYIEKHPDKKAEPKGSAVDAKKEAETAAAERARKAAEEREAEKKAKEAEQKKDEPQASADESSADQPSKDVQPRYHVLVPGDTLSEISRRYYGNAGHVNVIVQANNIADPRTLKVGDKLVIPPWPGEPAESKEVAKAEAAKEEQ